MGKLTQARPSESMDLNNSAYWDKFHCWTWGLGAPTGLFPGLRPNQLTVANILAMETTTAITSGSAITIRYDCTFHDGLPPHFNLDFTLFGGPINGPKFREPIRDRMHFQPCTSWWTPQLVIASFGFPTAASSGPIADWWRR